LNLRHLFVKGIGDFVTLYVKGMLSAAQRPFLTISFLNVGKDFEKRAQGRGAKRYNFFSYHSLPRIFFLGVFITKVKNRLQKIIVAPKRKWYSILCEPDAYLLTTNFLVSTPSVVLMCSMYTPLESLLISIFSFNSIISLYVLV